MTHSGNSKLFSPVNQPIAEKLESIQFDLRMLRDKIKIVKSKLDENQIQLEESYHNLKILNVKHLKKINEVSKINQKNPNATKETLQVLLVLNKKFSTNYNLLSEKVDEVRAIRFALLKNLDTLRNQRNIFKVRLNIFKATEAQRETNKATIMAAVDKYLSHLKVETQKLLKSLDAVFNEAQTEPSNVQEIHTYLQSPKGPLINIDLLYAMNASPYAKEAKTTLTETQLNLLFKFKEMSSLQKDLNESNISLDSFEKKVKEFITKEISEEFNKKRFIWEPDGKSFLETLQKHTTIRSQTINSQSKKSKPSTPTQTPTRSRSGSGT